MSQSVLASSLLAGHLLMLLEIFIALDNVALNWLVIAPAGALRCPRDFVGVEMLSSSMGIACPL